MEDVLDLYAAPYDPKRPAVCLDERPCQLWMDLREPLPMEAGRPRRVGYEDERKGSCPLFLVLQPLAGWRKATVTEHRTGEEFAYQMKSVVDEIFPEAEVIRVVLDTLNTHALATLYQTFPLEEARGIARKWEFHYTPKHASWLHMAEIELSVFDRRLKAFIPDDESLSREVMALVNMRKHSKATVDWQFRTEDARTKLKSLYPSIPD